jgi:hypothetical protein
MPLIFTNIKKFFHLFKILLNSLLYIDDYTHAYPNTVYVTRTECTLLYSRRLALSFVGVSEGRSFPFY